MTSDLYGGKGTQLIGQARSSFAVTPSDVIYFHTIAKGLYIGVSGDVSVVNADGTVELFKNVPVGVLPHQIQRVNASGTTATDIVALTDEIKQFDLSEVSGLTHNFDASIESSIATTGNEVQTWTNQVSGGANLSKDATNGGPDYIESSPIANNKPAISWGDVVSQKGLQLPTDATVNDIFAVMAYRNGIETTFDATVGYNTLFSSAAWKTGTPGDSNRIVGSANTDDLHSTNAFSQVRKNGATAGTQILPLPLTVCRLTPTSFLLSNVGGENAGATRSWRGIMCQLLFFSSAVSAYDAVRIQEYLKNKWGITQ